MANLCVDIGANLFQSIMYIGFLYFFFEKKFTTVKNILYFSFATLTFFTVLNLFLFILVPFNYFDFIVYVTILILYPVVAMKGKLSLKIIIPMCAFLINVVISYLFNFLFCAFTGYTFYELSMGPSIGRYLCIALSNFATAIAFLIILKFKIKSVRFTRGVDITSFILIPILALVTGNSAVYVLILSQYQDKLIPFLIAIVICMIVITAIVWLMISRISKDNEIKTKLLLMEQHEAIYKENILQTNEQIKKISHIKHDINNNLRCISDLITAKKYNEAKALCDDVFATSKNTYTPIATDNALLNAIVNVEMEKANSENLELVVKIYDDMSSFENFSGIVSIIGNLCDNAIEYLRKNEVTDKRIILEIYHQMGLYIISCRNCINGSVLSNNPELRTLKEDYDNHGHGIDIIRINAKKHSGSVECSEENGYITFTVLLNE